MVAILDDPRANGNKLYEGVESTKLENDSVQLIFYDGTREVIEGQVRGIDLRVYELNRRYQTS